MPVTVPFAPVNRIAEAKASFGISDQDDVKAVVRCSWRGASGQLIARWPLSQFTALGLPLEVAMRVRALIDVARSRRLSMTPDVHARCGSAPAPSFGDGHWITRRVLTSRFTDCPGRALVRADERTACGGDHDFSAVRRMMLSGGAVGVGVGVGVGVISAHNISRRYSLAAIISAPDDHFTAGPDCRVIGSGSGRIGGAGGCPTVRARIVSPAGVQKRCRR